MHNFEDWKEEQELEGVDEALSIAQRARIGRRMNRLRHRIQRKKKIRQKKMATRDQLEIRARRSARNVLTKKLSGGISKANMPVARRQAIEDKLKKKMPLIARMARKLMPQVRRSEVDRLKSFRDNQGTKKP